jgi:hypothetical protein
MFKKFKNFCKKVWEKIGEIIYNAVEKVKEFFRIDSPTEENTDEPTDENSSEKLVNSALFICDILMTVCVVAVTAKLLFPAKILSNPVVTLSIPASTLLAAMNANKGGA